MALDGLFLHVVKKELLSIAQNARVDKIHQPSKDEIVINLRGKGMSAKLLLTANANNPRAHFTNIALENPKAPPMFCMLLRKHLSTARLVNIRQEGLDRIIYFDFETVNELGDFVIITIILEIMGRHSNIIVVNQNGKIIDSIKRITEDMSSVRSILPGITYTLPPMQDKVNFFDFDKEEVKKIFIDGKNQDFAKSIVSVFQGVSPLLAREIAHYATGGLDLMKNDVSNFRYERMFEYIQMLGRKIENDDYNFTILLEKDKPKNFYFTDLEQYGSYLGKTQYESASELLDAYYSEKDRVIRVKQRSNDLLKLIVNLNDRVQRKLIVQKSELAESKNRDLYKMYGDLLNSNLFAINKGDKKIELDNYYDPEYKKVIIPLDIMLTPAQNAQKYYTEYRKAKTAEEKLIDLIQRGEEELVYLDSVFDALTRINGESDLLEIRLELIEQGYLKHNKKTHKLLKPLPPIKYKSDDGFTILCGRNNIQNDKLTLRDAKNYDMWLHTQGQAGSHVIIVSDKKEISDRAIEQAAMIAAYNSKSQSSAQVPVDYTYVKNVKKPNGAKPGMVIFDNYYTCYVTPNVDEINKLLVK